MEELAIAVAKTFSFLFRGSLRKYKAIEIEKVAMAMADAAKYQRVGKEIVMSEDMQ
jgi:hypothetical protein